MFCYYGHPIFRRPLRIDGKLDLSAPTSQHRPLLIARAVADRATAPRALQVTAYSALLGFCRRTPGFLPFPVIGIRTRRHPSALERSAPHHRPPP